MARTSFDHVSRFYDAFMRFWRVYHDDLVCEMLELSGRERLIDIGGGTGHYARRLAPRCSEMLVLDESGRMLSRVPLLGNVRVTRGDAVHTGLEGESFDRALIADVLHHVADHHGLMKEAHRLLKPGGRLVLLDFDFSKPTVKALSIFERYMILGRLHYLTLSQAHTLFVECGFHPIDRRVDGAAFAFAARRE
jgi:ubiquinone/menaquinone biosynthesis C-methylase UbiE